MKAAALLVALALLQSCSPPAEECSATLPCAAGFSCQAGHCQALDGGTSALCEETPPVTPKNLVPNPGFECGDPPTGWYNDHGKLSVARSSVRSGMAAARISDTDGWAALNLWLTPDVVTNPGTRTYCVRAWMRGSSVGRLTVRKVVNGSSVNDDSFSSPVDGNWVMVPPASYGAMKISGANELRYILRAWVPDPKPSDWLEVDDIQLWESPDGSCTSR